MENEKEQNTFTKITIDMPKGRCFECGNKINEKELDDYPCLNEDVKICSKCRLKFSDFCVKQVKTNKEYTNWYDAKYLGDYDDYKCLQTFN